MNPTKVIFIFALGILIACMSAVLPIQQDPSDAVTTFHVTKPGKAGTLRFDVQIKKKDKHNSGAPTTILVNVTEGMTRDEKLQALKDSLDTSYNDADWAIDLTSSSVSMAPKSTNTDVGRIKIQKVKDKSEEGFQALETKDYNVSGEPLELAPFPLGFFSPSSPPEPTWADWIVFSIDGSPSGHSSDGGASYIAVQANSLDIIVPTAGLTKNQILDQLLSESKSYSEFVGAIDYATGRFLLLSENDISIKGIGSKDSGLDINLEVMPSN